LYRPALRRQHAQGTGTWSSSPYSDTQPSNRHQVQQ
jgi:hypothetical protein